MPSSSICFLGSASKARAICNATSSADSPERAPSARLSARTARPASFGETLPAILRIARRSSRNCERRSHRSATTAASSATRIPKAPRRAPVVPPRARSNARTTTSALPASTRRRRGRSTRERNVPMRCCSSALTSQNVSKDRETKVAASRACQGADSLRCRREWERWEGSWERGWERRQRSR